MNKSQKKRRKKRS